MFTKIISAMGIVLAKEIDESKIQYYYKKTNMCEHILPADKAGMANSDFVANVVQDNSLMQLFIKNGIIIDDTKQTLSLKPHSISCYVEYKIKIFFNLIS